MFWHEAKYNFWSRINFHENDFKSAFLELDMEQQTGSKQEKEYIKAVYCHSAYKRQAGGSTSWNQDFPEKYQ